MRTATGLEFMAYAFVSVITFSCAEDTAIVVRPSDTETVDLIDSVAPSDLGVLDQDLMFSDSDAVVSAPDISLDSSRNLDADAVSIRDTMGVDGATRTDTPDVGGPSPDGGDVITVPPLNWEQGTPLPAARVGTVVGGHAGQVMVATGTGPQSVLTADIQLLNAESGIWGTGASFSPIRRYAAGTVFQTQLYVVLGLAPNNQGMASFVRYNPAQNAWKILLDNPKPGCCAGATSANERVWVLGGRLASTHTQSFSPAQGVWLAHEPMPVGTSFPAVVTDQAGDSIYVLGGATADTPNGGVTLSTVQRYSVQTDEWTILAELPEPRAAASAVWLEGMIWLFGGESNSGPAQSSVFVYSPGDDLWTVAEAMPNSRSRHGAAVLGDSVYLVGGIDEMGEPVSTVDVGNVKLF
jgi:hypothetical protein